MNLVTLFSRFGAWTFVCLVVAGCGSPRRDIDRTGTNTDFDENRSLFAAIRDADQLVLHEGLPHPFNEKRQFKQEEQRKDTVTFHDFQFYRSPLEVSAEDKAKLQGLLGAEGSFSQWRGEKKCGGFHPDYLAEWRAGDATYRVLICLGCHEVKVYGPGKSLRCDISLDAYKQLHELLKRYVKNRPPLQ